MRQPVPPWLRLGVSLPRDHSKISWRDRHEGLKELRRCKELSDDAAGAARLRRVALWLRLGWALSSRSDSDPATVALYLQHPRDAADRPYSIRR